MSVKLKSIQGRMYYFFPMMSLTAVHWLGHLPSHLWNLFLKLIHNLWQNFNDKLLYWWSQRAREKLNNSVKSFIDRKSERTKLRNSFRFHHIMKAHKPQRMVTDIHFLNINYSSFYFTFSFFHLGLETLVERIQNSSVLWMIFFLNEIIFMVRSSWQRKNEKTQWKKNYLFLLKSESQAT